MRRAPFLVSIVAVAVAACGPSATPSANPTVSPTAQAAAVFRCASRALAWDGTSAIDLTGTWAGDDEGVYYLRQVGDQIWWMGISGRDGPLLHRGSDWTNVYLGKLSGDTITGTYADVPQGKILDNGPVVLKLTPTSGGGITLLRTDPLLSTGFGGSRLTPCQVG